MYHDTGRLMAGCIMNWTFDGEVFHDTGRLITGCIMTLDV